MKVSSPIRIAACRLWLPGGYETSAEAVRSGKLDTDAAERDGYQGTTVSDGPSAPEMAVLAAKEAMAGAGTTGDCIGLVAHAWLYHQGHDFWSPTHYVAAMTGADEAIAVGVQQMCNGGSAAIEAAITRMLCEPKITTALVTTADRFCPPGFDRWRDYGVAYGDGATALILGRVDGPYQILASATACAPALETMHRGQDEFSLAPLEHGTPIDIRRTKKAFLERGNGPRFAAEAGAAVHGVVRTALSTAQISLDDRRLRYIALPRLGGHVLEQAYLPPLRGLTRAQVLNLGRDTGHLGAGDPLANLADIHTLHRPDPGEIVLLLSAGAGFSWTCIVVRACPSEIG
jgi:3-oxoacyl-[acyl-carrier-protein] synthase III